MFVNMDCTLIGVHACSCAQMRNRVDGCHNPRLQHSEIWVHHDLSFTRTHTHIVTRTPTTYPHTHTLSHTHPHTHHIHTLSFMTSLVHLPTQNTHRTSFGTSNLSLPTFNFSLPTSNLHILTSNFQFFTSNLLLLSLSLVARARATTCNFQLPTCNFSHPSGIPSLRWPHILYGMGSHWEALPSKLQVVARARATSLQLGRSVTPFHIGSRDHLQLGRKCIVPV